MPDESNAVTDHHRALSPFAGEFTAEVKFWMGPGEPRVWAGVMVNEWDLGGTFLKQTYTGDSDPNAPFSIFEGRGYWGFNTTTGRYEGFWIDTASTMMQTETGEYDPSNRRWTMHSAFIHPETGAPMTKRSVFTLLSDDEHLIESFYLTPDGGEFKVMEIRFVRSS